MSTVLKRIISFAIVLTAVFCGGCRPDTGTGNFSDRQPEAENQTAIRVSQTEIDSAEPAIAADGNGNLYVVFVEHNPDKSSDVYLQKFNEKLEPTGEKTRVNSEKGQAKAWFGDPPTVKIGDDGAVYVGWTARVAGAEKSAATVLFLSVSRDGGKSFDAPVKVNDDEAPASHGMHSLEIGNDGKVFMAWLDERNVMAVPPHGAASHDSAEPNSEVFFAFSADGGKSFSKNIKLSSEVCPCCKTNLVIDRNGKIYASWRQVVGDNFRHIAVASSENNGESFSDYRIVSDDQWQINACPVSGAPLTADRENNLKTVWFTSGKAGPPGLYFSESNDGGKTFAPRKAVFENLISGTPNFIAGENGKFFVVWETDEKIYFSDLENREREIADGTNPASVFANGKIYTAFVKKEGENRSVWLAANN